MTKTSTGTYRYDKKKGKIVRVSDRVPKVSSKGKRASAALPCGRREKCGGGGCMPVVIHGPKGHRH